MKETLETLKQQPKEVLQWIILELMASDKLSFAELAEIHVKHLEQLKKGETKEPFAELAEIHVKHLEQLKKGETKELMKLRSEVISLWCGTKKELPSKLVSLITEGMNKGWVNLTQEQIDNSKWNR